MFMIRPSALTRYCNWNLKCIWKLLSLYHSWLRLYHQFDLHKLYELNKYWMVLYYFFLNVFYIFIFAFQQSICRYSFDQISVCIKRSLLLFFHCYRESCNLCWIGIGFLASCYWLFWNLLFTAVENNLLYVQWKRKYRAKL